MNLSIGVVTEWSNIYFETRQKYKVQREQMGKLFTAKTPVTNGNTISPKKLRFTNDWVKDLTQAPLIRHELLDGDSRHFTRIVHSIPLSNQSEATKRLVGR